MKHPYSAYISDLLEQKLKAFPSHSPVDKACFHAVQGGGRIRPIIIQAIAKALKSSISVDAPALSVELLHCASLTADDMPCMDNDLERRGRASVHAAYGEETALLASYKLIALAYHVLSEAPATLPLERHLLSLKTVSSRCIQMIHGQFSDLHGSLDSQAKTTALFQAAFALGWIYGGGALDRLHAVESAAFEFGMAFQIADDICDRDETAEKGLAAITKHLSKTKETLKTLGLFSSEMDCVIELFEKRFYDELSASSSSGFSKTN